MAVVSQQGAEPAVAVVSESLPRGAFVAHVTVADHDATPDYSRVTCDVTPSRDSSYFRLVPHHLHEYLARHL